MKHSAVCGLLMLSLAALAASVPPPPRLARQLPQERTAASALRARHNEALRQLFASTGIPLGDSPSNVAARAEAIDLINSAITNRLEIGGTGVSADAVAAAVEAFVGRHSETNQTQQGGK